MGEEKDKDPPIAAAETTTSSRRESASSPERKRSRLDGDEKTTTSTSQKPPQQRPRIEAILPDSLIKPITFERCAIATLADKQKLSEFIREINRVFPLPNYQHLKRVKNGRVFLFPLSLLPKGTGDESGSLQQSIKDHLQNSSFSQSLIDSCGEFTVEDLAQVAPQLKCQYEEVAARWPCKFHEDKALERLFRNENFSQREIAFHCRMMGLCTELGRRHPHVRSESVAMTFDPTRNEIVAVGWRPQSETTTDKDPRNATAVVEQQLNSILPSRHAAMRAIDNVAKEQGGGAWRGGEEEGEEKEEDVKLQEVLQFARSEFKSFSELHLNVKEELKYGTYLCTGFDMYLSEEPCLMCSMAMVHSRVKRIFFQRNNAESGALGGGNKLKLHGVKELNHHYEVFRVNGD